MAAQVIRPHETSIGFLLRYVQRHRTDLFALYRIALGGLIVLSLR